MDLVEASQRGEPAQQRANLAHGMLSPTAGRAWPVACALCFALYSIVLIRTAWLCDDAFIGFRAVDNFVNGYGLTYNVNERVQSYTNPLWLLIFSIPYSITREPYYTAIVLCLVTSLAAVAWFACKVARTWTGATLGVLVLSLSVAFVDYSTSGLENPLVHLLLVVFLGIYLASLLPEGEGGGRNSTPFVLALLAALAATNRMDSILLFLPALAHTFYRQRSWRTLFAMAVAFIPLALWMGFALFYYGSLFPNTAYGKLYNSVCTTELAERGCYYLWNSLKWDPLTLTTIAASLVLACRQRSAASIAVAAGILLYLLYTVKVGGDFMSGRFLTAPLMAAVVLLSTVRWRNAGQWVSALAGMVVLAALSRTPTVLSGSDFGADWDWSHVVAEHGVADERAFYYDGTGLLRAFRHTDTAFPDFDVAEQGRKMRAAAEGTERRLAMVRMTGMLGYYAGPNCILIDRMAVTDPLLARLPNVRDPYWRAGHLDRPFLKGYVETLQSGRNTIQDPGVAAYYDHLTMITQGDLWSRRRLVAIWEQHLGAWEHLLEPMRERILRSPPEVFQLSPEFEVALEEFNRTIQSDPENPRAYMNRAFLFYQAGKLDQAIEDLGRAIALDPDNAPARKVRGEWHLKRAQPAQAIKDFTRAIELDPSDVSAYELRGSAHAQTQNWQGAIADFQRIIALSPRSPSGYYFLAHVLAGAGGVEKQFSLPAEEPGETLPAVVALAWVLATHPHAPYRDGNAAVRYAEQARTMDDAERPDVLDALAASYAEVGRFNEAATAAEQALQRAVEKGNGPLAAEIRGRMQLYLIGKPYHLSSRTR